MLSSARGVGSGVAAGERSNAASAGAGGVVFVLRRRTRGDVWGVFVGTAVAKPTTAAGGRAGAPVAPVASSDPRQGSLPVVGASSAALGFCFFTFFKTFLVFLGFFVCMSLHSAGSGESSTSGGVIAPALPSFSVAAVAAAATPSDTRQTAGESHDALAASAPRGGTTAGGGDSGAVGGGGDRGLAALGAASADEEQPILLMGYVLSAERCQSNEHIPNAMSRGSSAKIPQTKPRNVTFRRSSQGAPSGSPSETPSHAKNGSKAHAGLGACGGRPSFAPCSHRLRPCGTGCRPTVAKCVTAPR